MFGQIVTVFALLALCPRLGVDPVRLSPGHPRVAADRISEGADTTRIWWTANGQTRPGPTQIESVRRVQRQGRRAIEHRIAVSGGRVALDDTTWYDARTLAPLAHRSHGNGRAFSLDYEAGQVRGSVVDSTGTTMIDVAVPEAVFDPSALHLVIRAVEFEPGATLLLPFFNHETRSVRLDTVAVEGSEALDTDGGPVPVWRLSVRAAGRRATYFVRKTDGHELKVEVRVGAGEMRVLAPGVR